MPGDAMSDRGDERPDREDVGWSDPADVMRRSWDTNAAGWTRVVREELLASRKLATDAAIVEAIMSLRPRRVLDVGCGEGWLARELAGRGLDVVGIDGSMELIQAARAAGGAAFSVCAYDELVAEPRGAGEGYDVTACNFSLLEERIAPVLAALRTRLRPGGAVVVQTVHPWTARGDEGYRDGWRTETFAAMAGAAGISQPMPWYFRTLESWISELETAGLRVSRVREPVHPDSGEPLSLLLTAHAAPASPT